MSDLIEVGDRVRWEKEYHFCLTRVWGYKATYMIGDKVVYIDAGGRGTRIVNTSELTKHATPEPSLAPVLSYDREAAIDASVSSEASE